MKEILIKLFIKNPEDVHLPEVRQRYGQMTSIVGIAINLMLFASKFTVGTLFGIISVTADAVNNLSDAGNSIISLLSFRMSAKPADKDHPYGHARIEYLASTLVAVLILMVGLELGKASVQKILKPGAISFSTVTAIVLLVSIIAKYWMYTFNKSLSRKVDSTMMLATAADSISDVMATSAVLLSMILSPLIKFQLDGYMGVVVALSIMRTGFGVLRETVDRMLGKGPGIELAGMIHDFIMRYDGVINIHDLLVHDYGPNRTFASVHVEVDAKVDILKSHDLIDNIEIDIKREHNINLVIHLDPVIIDDEYVNSMKRLTQQIIESIDPVLSFHDFRVVRGQTHSNLIFDLMMPFEYPMKKSEVAAAFSSALKKRDSSLRAVINFDRG